MNKPLVVNLYGGPASGKSTLAAQLFANLKWQGINCELVTEYAKDRVWADHLAALDDQLYLLGKQHNRVWRLRNKVDIIVTDSPILLSSIYGYKESLNFHNLVWEIYNKYWNINFFLNRDKPFRPEGRTQRTEDEAIHVDNEILGLLKLRNIKYQRVMGNNQGSEIIIEEVLRKYNEG